MTRRATTAALLVVVSLVAACGGDGEEGTALDATTTTESEAETTTTTEADEAGGSTTTPDDYAEQVCSSIDDWFVEVSTASEDLTTESATLAQDPASGKALVIGFLDEVIGDTEDLSDSLEAAGVPDTPSGEQVATELLAGIDDVRTLFAGARDDTAALPEDDPQALGLGLQEIGTTLQDSANGIGAGVERALTAADDPELSAALNGAPACLSLGAP